MKLYTVTLTKEEREELRSITAKGTYRSWKVINALILLACDEGEFQKDRSTNKEISKVMNVSMRKIDRVKKNFVMDGLDITLNGHTRNRTYKKKIDGDFEAHLIAISCSEPPEGFGRWSLRLLADKVVELGYVDSISHETIRYVLKKTNLNLGKKKDG